MRGATTTSAAPFFAAPEILSVAVVSLKMTFPRTLRSFDAPRFLIESTIWSHKASLESFSLSGHVESGRTSISIPMIGEQARCRLQILDFMSRVEPDVLRAAESQSGTSALLLQSMVLHIQISKCAISDLVRHISVLTAAVCSLCSTHIDYFGHATFSKLTTTSRIRPYRDPPIVGP